MTKANRSMSLIEKAYTYAMVYLFFVAIIFITGFSVIEFINMIFQPIIPQQTLPKMLVGSLKFALILGFIVVLLVSKDLARLFRKYRKRTIQHIEILKGKARYFLPHKRAKNHHEARPMPKHKNK